MTAKVTQYQLTHFYTHPFLVSANILSCRWWLTLESMAGSLSVTSLPQQTEKQRIYCTFWYCFFDNMPGNKISYTAQQFWYGYLKPVTLNQAVTNRLETCKTIYCTYENTHPPKSKSGERRGTTNTHIHRLLRGSLRHIFFQQLPSHSASLTRPSFCRLG